MLRSIQKIFKRKQIALALGGGGARGLAHIGVLKVLEEEKISIDLLAGTSIGALVGGAYACGISPGELEQSVVGYLSSPEFAASTIRAIEAAQGGRENHFREKIQNFLKNRYQIIQAMFKLGILSQEDFRPMIEHFLPDILIEDTKIPFRAMATDLVRGELVTFSHGSLRDAVAASCAVPGAIEPLREGERLLSDGGTLSLIPASVAKEEGADIVIAVAVDQDIGTEEEFTNAMSIYCRAAKIMAHKLKDYELKDADIVILPQVGNLNWTDFSHGLIIVAEGEKAAREKLPEMRRKLLGCRRWLPLSRVKNLTI
ncbi:MAG: patatin-like phospholipase family protein [Proteobacteria bacterium]|nr:patatin-like phospholipase family protein [Pseudomonadota bacterium]